MAMSLRSLSAFLSSTVKQQSSYRTCLLLRPIYNQAIRYLSGGQKQNARYSLGKLALYGVGVAITFSSAVAVHSKWSERGRQTVSAAEMWLYQDNGNSSARKKWNFLADVVEKTAPAVVYISIQGKNPFLGASEMTMSSGSGFIVREDGLILTNAHVVGHRSKTSIEVQLHDGRMYKAKVQAIDPVSDLATIKIDAERLPTLKLGKSSEIRPGEWVVALGSPLQLSNSVTSGIVSAPCRSSAELGLYNKDIEYIQTDAVINFGNSGGPLVNLDGEAIGINTMKVTTGISFAIPSDYAREFLEKADKIEKRSQSKGWFASRTKEEKRRYVGITMLTLTPNLIQEIKLRQGFPDIKHGVLVYRVIKDSPAYEGGLRPGDIILKINDKDIKSSADVYRAVEANESLIISVHRGSDVLTLTVKTEEITE